MMLIIISSFDYLTNVLGYDAATSKQLVQQNKQGR